MQFLFLCNLAFFFIVRHFTVWNIHCFDYKIYGVQDVAAVLVSWVLFWNLETSYIINSNVGQCQTFEYGTCFVTTHEVLSLILVHQIVFLFAVTNVRRLYSAAMLATLHNDVRAVQQKLSVVTWSNGLGSIQLKSLDQFLSVVTVVNDTRKTAF